MADAVRVEGIPELLRKLDEFDKGFKREFQKELRAVGEPIAADIRGRVSRFGPKTEGGVRPATRVGALYVKQTVGRTTGRRGDFGALQMRTAFLPALDGAKPGVIRGLDDMLGRLADKFNS